MNTRSKQLILFCILGLILIVSAVPSLAQDLPPRDEAASLEENLGYGYNTKDGGLSLSVNTLATFCPQAASIAVDQAEEKAVLTAFNAKDLGDGTWEIPDPDTGTPVISRVQYATSAYEDESGGGSATGTELLPLISKANVSIVPILWGSCWRLRRGYACGNVGSCKSGCLSGYSYTHVRNHLVCRYTGSRTDRCLEFLSPVCRLNRYTCRDCTGPIIASWPNYRWVCAVF